MFTINIMANWDFTLTVGKTGLYKTLSDASTHIPLRSSRVLVVVNSCLLQDVDLNIPDNRGIDHLKITSQNNESQDIDFLGCSIYANGITVEIDTSITLRNCFLFGGSKAEKGERVTKHASHLIIRGKADYVFAGGYAIGPGSVSGVSYASVELAGGAVNFLNGGGYAVQQGTVNSSYINITVDKSSSVTKQLNGGNYLAGPRCSAATQDIQIQLEGKIYGKISLAGYTAFNSSAAIHGKIHFDAGQAVLHGDVCKVTELSCPISTKIMQITGSISPGQQYLIKDPMPGIKVIQSPGNSPSSKPPEKNTVSPTLAELNEDEAYSNATETGNKRKKHLILFFAFLIIIFILLNSGQKTEKKPVYSSTRITESLPHEKTVIPTVKTKKPTPTVRLIQKTPKTVVTTAAPSLRTPTSTSVNVSVTPNVLPSETSYETWTATEEADKPITGTIQSSIDTGTYLRQNPYVDNSNVIRWLPNDTEVIIQSGPVSRNGYEWYEVFCESFNRSGWVVCSSVQNTIQ